MESQTCGFTGNDDIYGLGIRIGLYAQTFAVWLGGDLIPQNTRELVTINSLFVLSMLASVVVSSARSSIHAAEAFIIVSMLLSTHFTGPVLRHRSQILFNKGLESHLATLILNILIACYTNWFWWRDLDRLPPTSCGTFGLVLFYKFNLYEQIRIVNKVFWILYVIWKMPFFIRRALEVFTLTWPRKTPMSELREKLRQEAEAATTRLIAQQGSGYKTTFEKRPKSNPLRPTPKVADLLKRAESWSFYVTDFANVEVASNGCYFAHENPRNNTNLKDIPQREFPILATVFAADEFLTEIFNAYNSQISQLKWVGFTVKGLPFYITPLRPLMAVYGNAICVFLRTLSRSPKRLLPILIVRLLFILEPWLASGHENTILVKEILNHPQSKNFSFQDLQLAAQVRASRIAPARPIHQVLRSSILGLLFCSVLVVTVELTIRWNHIRLYQNLSSVGQLVPFLVGSGSLARVLYMEAKHWYVHGTGTLASKKQTTPRPRPWADSYFIWKDQHLNAINGSSK